MRSKKREKPNYETRRWQSPDIPRPPMTIPCRAIAACIKWMSTTGGPPLAPGMTMLVARHEPKSVGGTVITCSGNPEEESEDAIMVEAVPA